MGLFRRASVAAGKPLHDGVAGPDHDESLAAATATGTDPDQQYLTRRPSEIERWREAMEHSSSSSSSILPGFRGLWQSQGRVLMLFAASLAALVYYVSLVSAPPFSTDIWGGGAGGE